MSIKDVIQLRL